MRVMSPAAGEGPPSSSEQTLTEQAIFDQSVAGLSRQGRPSQAMIEGRVACAYRGTGGRRCAVGLVITDAEYHPRMEGLKIIQVSLDGLLPRRLTRFLPLLEDLQAAHDGWPQHGRAWFKRRLEAIAAFRKLDRSALDHAFAGVLA